MKVFRFICAETLRGIYAGTNLVRESNIPTCDDRHPEPEDDFDEIINWEELVLYSTWRFGFVSFKQVQKWFNSHEREVLEHNGAIVAEFNVDDKYVIQTDRQLIFDVNKATFVCWRRPFNFSQTTNKRCEPHKLINWWVEQEDDLRLT